MTKWNLCNFNALCAEYQIRQSKFPNRIMTKQRFDSNWIPDSYSIADTRGLKRKSRSAIKRRI